MPLAGEYLYHADLTRVRDVRRTAGTAVNVADLDDAHVLGQLQLTAVAQPRQLVRLREPCPDRQVGAHGLVRAALYVHELCPVQLAAEVDGHALGTHVEADVFVSVNIMHKAGDYVLAGVVLHTAQALLAVYAAGITPQRGGGGRIVYDLAAALLHVGHGDAADDAGVGELTAALGEEGGAIKDDAVAALKLAALQHLGLKFKHVAVKII